MRTENIWIKYIALKKWNTERNFSNEIIRIFHIFKRFFSYLLIRLFLICVNCSKFSGANKFLSVIRPVPQNNLSEAREAGNMQKISFAIVDSKEKVVCDSLYRILGAHVF